MDENEKLTPTPEELKADEEAQKSVSDDELKTQLAEKFGIDSETEGELLGKLVEDAKSNRDRLSGAIKQKINWRTRAEQKFKDSDKDKTPNKDKSKDSSPEDVDKMVEQKLSERLEARDLKDLALSEEIEEEVKTLAKLKGISVREAHKLPYIQGLIKEAGEKERLKAASPSHTPKGSSVKVTVDVSKPLDPDDFDFDTKEGVAAWNEAKRARADYERTH